MTEAMDSGRCILLIPGRDETQRSSTASTLRDLGWAPAGPDLDEGLLRQRFPDQVGVVRTHVERVVANPLVPIVARSFGAYLLLHAILEHGSSERFPAPILLLAPVLGPGIVQTPSGVFGSFPPRAGVIMARVRSGTSPPLRRLRICIGADDVCAGYATEFANHVPEVTCHLVAGVSHTFSPEVERQLLSDFLQECALGA